MARYAFSRATGLDVSIAERILKTWRRDKATNNETTWRRGMGKRGKLDRKGFGGGQAILKRGGQVNIRPDCQY